MDCGADVARFMGAVASVAPGGLAAAFVGTASEAAVDDEPTTPP